jgi:alkanesulfonate monooxygenase SsuD/methylene tetrahydromethanopterin reductase-like flavin-dependent oxidoreductase (luciferase family)
MRFALNVPNFGEYADPRTFVRLAREAEVAGWDALFVWDHLLVDPDWGVPIADPWVLLSAAAAVTERIRLGPMVTPLPRRRPWDVARQSVTLDRLSDGRLTLGVGLGAPPEADFEAFGEESDLRVRAEKLDEALAIIDGLWTDAPFEFVGARYRLARMRFSPGPVQRPRIPIWVAGYWPHRGPFRRAAAWDGVVPASRVTDETGAPIPVEELKAVLDVIRQARGSDGLEGYDVVVAGGTPSDRDAAAAIVAPYAAAGATWWSEGLNGWRGTLEEMEARLRAGPPSRATMAVS